MQVITAQFITQTGFATWLTPQLEITNLSSGSVDVVTMTESNAWNYYYNFEDYNQDVVYFFKYDAWSDTVINRYQWTTNNEVKVVYQQWGSSASMNAEQEKEKKLIKKIVKLIMEEMETLMSKKHKETLGAIVKIIPQSDVEIDYWYIDHSIEKNTLEIIKSVKSIKIPKCEHKEINKLIKESLLKVCSDILKKPDKEYIEEIYEKIMEEIKQRTKWEIKKSDIKKLMMESLENDDDMKMLLLENDEEFKSLMEKDE